MDEGRRGRGVMGLYGCKEGGVWNARFSAKWTKIRQIRYLCSRCLVDQEVDNLVTSQVSLGRAGVSGLAPSYVRLDLIWDKSGTF